MGKVETDYWSDEEKETDYSFVAEVEWDHESYQFSLTRVYQQKSTGKLFYATDSGCSCPIPFENTTEDELWPIESLQDWYNHVSSRTVVDDEYNWRNTPPATFDEIETARKVIESLL